jgi:hypothetical protein
MCKIKRKELIIELMEKHDTKFSVNRKATEFYKIRV